MDEHKEEVAVPGPILTQETRGGQLPREIAILKVSKGPKKWLCRKPHFFLVQV
jgi:hypothetical protein